MKATFCTWPNRGEQTRCHNNKESLPLSTEITRDWGGRVANEWGGTHGRQGH